MSTSISTSLSPFNGFIIKVNLKKINKVSIGKIRIQKDNVIMSQPESTRWTWSTMENHCWFVTELSSWLTIRERLTMHTKA